MCKQCYVIFLGSTDLHILSYRVCPRKVKAIVSLTILNLGGNSDKNKNGIIIIIDSTAFDHVYHLIIT